jgi:uncharacterized integral membrane protein
VSKNPLPAPTAPRTSAGARESAKRGLVTARNLLLVAVLALFVWFAAENAGYVQVDWWVWDTRMRLIYVILAAFAFGVVVDRLFLLSRRRRRKGQPQQPQQPPGSPASPPR